MKRFERILCPVDLSENSHVALEMATELAKQHDGKLVLIFVGVLCQADISVYCIGQHDSVLEADKERFLELRPTDDSVAFEHVYIVGNPGAEIVRATESCDLVVMATHGATGLMRLLMGSVAEYVVRHARCPVMALKNVDFKLSKDPDPVACTPTLVTQVMRHVHPIHSFDKIDSVLVGLERANETGTPVIDDNGKCIGVFTRADIAKYRNLQYRLEAGDETVVDEVFETDKYGMRRTDNTDFDQVHRHMTTPVVTVSNTASCTDAETAFQEHSSIHHLVVVDHVGCPVGMLEPEDLVGCRQQSVPG